MIFVGFKGVDGHGGAAPSSVVNYVADLEATIDKDVPESERVNRCGFVTYATHAGNNRTAGMAFTSPVTYGTRAPLRKAELTLRNFAEHGRDFLGNQADCMNRFALELCIAFHNQAVAAGFLSIDIDTLLPLLMYASAEEPDKVRHCDKMRKFNPNMASGRSEIAHGLARFSWMVHLVNKVHLGLNKASIYAVVNKAQDASTRASQRLSGPVHFTRTSIPRPLSDEVIFI